MSSLRLLEFREGIGLLARRFVRGVIERHSLALREVLEAGLDAGLICHDGRSEGLDLGGERVSLCDAGEQGEERGLLRGALEEEDIAAAEIRALDRLAGAVLFLGRSGAQGAAGGGDGEECEEDEEFHSASFWARTSLTTLGLAFPFESFMTWPLMKLIASVLPRLVFGDGLRVGRDGLVAHRLDRARVALLFEAFLLHDLARALLPVRRTFPQTPPCPACC